MESPLQSFGTMGVTLNLPLRWKTVAAAALIVIVGAIAYSDSFENPFVFDDLRLIPDNPILGPHWSPWQLISTSFHTRPVIGATVALNYAIGGLDVRGYHAVNLIIHLLAALTLWGIVRRTLRLPRLAARYGSAADGLALTIALLWALHPMQTMAVTYIIQRCESLMGLFYLLTLYAVLRGATSERAWGRWFAAAILASWLGMASKQPMLTAPILVGLYDRIFLANSWKEVLRRRWFLYAGLAVTWCIIFSLAWARQPIEAAAPWWQYALSQPEVIVRYLRLAVWPNDLCMDYYWPAVTATCESGNFSLSPLPIDICYPVITTSRDVLMPTAILLPLLALTFWTLVRRPAWGFMGMWFWIILAPTSSILPLPDIIFEHRMYLPLAAVVTVVVILGYEAWRRLLPRLDRPGAEWRFPGWCVPAAAVGILALVLGNLTFLRNQDYGSVIAAWQDTCVKQPKSARAHANLAAHLIAEERLDEAFPELEEAIRLCPTFVDAYNNRGYILLRWDRPEESIPDFTEAMILEPTRTDAPYNRGLAYQRTGRPEEAVEDFTTALKNNPRYADAYVARAGAYIELKRYHEAAADYTQLIGLRPADPTACESRALAHYHLGEYEKAWADVMSSRRLGGSPPESLLGPLSAALPEPRDAQPTATGDAESESP